MTFLNVARKQMRAILGVNIYGLMRRKILILKELMKYHKNFSKDLTNHKIEQYNKLLENVCLKHNVTLIKNTNIDESRLNGSKLHLNRFGDIALGSAFCSYLRSLRVRARTPGTLQGSVDSRNDHFLSKVYGHRAREWTIHLNCVRRMMT